MNASRRVVIRTCIALAIGLAQVPATSQGAHCVQEFAIGVQTAEQIVKALDIGPRSDAQRGLVRYRTCPEGYAGALLRRPAGVEFFILDFVSSDSAQLKDNSAKQLEEIAKAMKSDVLIRFGFRLNISRASRNDSEADTLLDARRTAIAAALANDYGVPSGRIQALQAPPTRSIGVASGQAVLTIFTSREVWFSSSRVPLIDTKHRNVP